MGIGPTPPDRYRRSAGVARSVHDVAQTGFQDAGEHFAVYFDLADAANRGIGLITPDQGFQWMAPATAAKLAFALFDAANRLQDGLMTQRKSERGSPDTESGSARLPHG